MFKMGIIRNNQEIEFKYDNIYQLENHENWSRLSFGSAENQVSLMLDWASGSNSIFEVLYVLKGSRHDNKAGRYQNVTPCTFEQLSAFLNEFKDFFQKDSRHHIWIIDIKNERQLIYDSHEIIYAYGDLDNCKLFLSSKGFREGTVQIPIPHTHHYHSEYDLYEDKVFGFWEWKWFPLNEEIDNP